MEVSAVALDSARQLLYQSHQSASVVPDSAALLSHPPVSAVASEALDHHAADKLASKLNKTTILL